ncbi:MAG: hypothetical protein ACSLE1_08005 [Sphingobium sp.]
MKQDFPVKPRAPSPDENQPQDHDPVEFLIQMLSRAAGPLALICGYIAVYAAFKYMR